MHVDPVELRGWKEWIWKAIQKSNSAREGKIARPTPDPCYVTPHSCHENHKKHLAQGEKIKPSHDTLEKSREHPVTHHLRTVADDEVA